MVKINFKTVQNKLFAVEAEDTETVGQLKKKIQESQTFPAENQKLIYSGKILNDTATVGSLKIKEKDFLVVMVSKPKAQPAAPAASTSASTSAPAAASTPAASSAPAPATEAPATTTIEAPAASAAAPSTESASEAPSQGIMGGSFVSGSALQSAIEGMVEMGFPRDQVQKALRASFNNPDRAVEYLMSGNIPEVEGAPRAPRAPQAAPAAAPAPAATPAPAAPSAPAPAPTPAAAPAAPAAAPAPSGGSADNLFAAAEAAMNRDRGMPAGGGVGVAPGGAGAPGAAGGAGGAGLAGLGALADSPYIQQLRQMVTENPALIQPLLQQIAAQNPQLAALIQQNPQVLYELLGAGGEGEGDDEDFGGAQVMQVDLTEQEAAAVERLEALGFDRQMVLQAYMLCDKNEELAANFLFDAGDDDMA